MDHLLAESGKAIEHGKCYRSATREKEVEKWRTMDNGWKAVEQDGAASMMALGIKKSVAHHLVSMAVKGGQTPVGTLKEQPLI